MRAEKLKRAASFGACVFTWERGDFFPWCEEAGSFTIVLPSDVPFGDRVTKLTLTTPEAGSEHMPRLWGPHLGLGVKQVRYNLSRTCFDKAQAG